MKIIIQDKEVIKECKEYLKKLLKDSTYFYKIASDDDMDSIIECAIDECWFFTGKVTNVKDFNNLKQRICKKLPRKSNNELYDVYKDWTDNEYRFIISEAILAMSTVKSRRYSIDDNSISQSDEIDSLIKKK